MTQDPSKLSPGDIVYIDKFKLVENMRRRGGNFVEKLADALIAADPKNAKRIMEAFPDIVEKYS
jgi:hypothetical protein